METKKCKACGKIEKTAVNRLGETKGGELLENFIIINEDTCYHCQQEYMWSE